MAKTSGVGITALTIDDSSGTARNVINDIGDFQISTPRAVQDVTGVDKSAMERLLLLADASVTVNGFYNDAATTGLHSVLKTVPSTSVLRQMVFTITGTVGANTLTLETMITDYALTRASDGALTVTAPAVLANGAVPTWA
jgi:hypothetical protein